MSETLTAPTDTITPPTELKTAVELAAARVTPEAHREAMLKEAKEKRLKAVRELRERQAAPVKRALGHAERLLLVWKIIGDPALLPSSAEIEELRTTQKQVDDIDRMLSENTALGVWDKHSELKTAVRTAPTPASVEALKAFDVQSELRRRADVCDMLHHSRREALNDATKRAILGWWNRAETRVREYLAQLEEGHKVVAEAFGVTYERDNTATALAGMADWLHSLQQMHALNLQDTPRSVFAGLICDL